MKLQERPGRSQEVLLLMRDGAVHHCLLGLPFRLDHSAPAQLCSQWSQEVLCVSVQGQVCPVCHLCCYWLAAVAEGHACFLPNTPHTKNTIATSLLIKKLLVYSGLTPVKGYLHKIGISRFSICSGLLLLGALKRPTESAKNQCASV